MNVHRTRFGLPILAASAALAVTGAVALESAATASAQPVEVQQQTSQNWAGYVATSNTGSQRFSSVSGSWVEPSVGSSSTSGDGYSAFWVGLGGSSGQSQSLEQVGTSADTTNGQTQYYAWYELVPAPETRLNLAVNPGDHMTAKVSVNGSTVTISLSDQTTGQSVTKTLQMSNPDTSSAEWIAEAPSTYTDGGNTQVLPLADFGKVTFTGASATSDGHTGSISDPNWSVQQVQLSGSSGAGGFPGAGIAGAGQYVSAGSSAGGQTSSLSSDGSSFSVSYASSSGSSGEDQASSGDGGIPASGYVPGGGYSPSGGYSPGGYSPGDGYAPGYIVVPYPYAYGYGI